MASNNPPPPPPPGESGSGASRRQSGGMPTSTSTSNSPGAPYTYAPNQMFRRSSYASVVAGDSQRPSSLAAGLSGTTSAQLPNPFAPSSRIPHTVTPSSSFPPQHSGMPYPESGRRTTIEFETSHPSSLSRVRSGTVPSSSSVGFASAFISTNESTNATRRESIASAFFIPTYLEGSRYAEKLTQEHKLRTSAAGRDPKSPYSSGPGSLSTSSSSVNLHSHSHSNLHGLSHISSHRLVPSYRGMTHDIVEHPPRPHYPAVESPNADGPAPPLPSRWSEMHKHSSVELSNGGLEVKMTNPARKTGEDAGVVRADHAIPKQAGIYYFEVEVLGSTRGAPVGSQIGIGFQAANTSLARMPGWEPCSWAYHGDDGHIYATRESGKPYGSKYGKGDTVGCGINFRTRTAFFTKNGSFLAIAFKDVGNETLYPVVGLKNHNEHIRVNFGQEPFHFDIIQMMRKETQSIREDVDQADTSALYPPLSERQLIHKLIAQYLSHDGYIETVKAFSDELRREDEAFGIHTDPLQGPLQELDVEERRDALTRQSDLDTGLQLTKENYPAVFENNDLIYFRLRCRKFIEMIRLSTSSATSRHAVEESERRKGKKISKNRGSFDHDGVFGHQMELDEQIDNSVEGQKTSKSSERAWESAMETNDEPSVPAVGNGAGTNVSTSVNGQEHTESGKISDIDLFTYGAALRSEFASDSRREVKRELENTLALMAYPDPRESALADLLDESNRDRLAEELNSAILVSQGKASSAALERLVQQSDVMLAELGDDGGPGAFLNLRGDFLVTDR